MNKNYARQELLRLYKVNGDYFIITFNHKICSNLDNTMRNES
jgi:hypothetical protein